jgi:hypothetical protein
MLLRFEESDIIFIYNIRLAIFAANECYKIFSGNNPRQRSAKASVDSDSESSSLRNFGFNRTLTRLIASEDFILNYLQFI